MAKETEIKIRLNSDQQVEILSARCEKLYGEATEIIQRDEYFDTSEELLKQKDFAVRLRIVNGKARVALKGPRGFFDDNIHQRIELEFYVLNEEEARREIASQHLIATAVLEKRRRRFQRDDLKVAIDSLPFIGSFLEIEAETTERIRKILTLLQLSSEDAVPENYSELLEQKLIELGLPVRPNLRATFDAEAAWRSQTS